MRIFFGATLPDETKRQIAEIQAMLRPEIWNARFEGRDKLHITLLFIGDLRPQKVDALFNSAAVELGKHSGRSPSTEIIGMNYFPNWQVRRGIWLDCRDDGSLASFADSVKTASMDYGVVPEKREFKPHITIARLPESAGRRTGKAGLREESGERRSHEAPDLHKFTAEGKLPMER